MKNIFLITLVLFYLFYLTDAIAQSQRETKLIFQKPESKKQYYLTIGDQIDFVFIRDRDTTCSGEILKMDASKFEIILKGSKDTIVGKYLERNRKALVYEKQWVPTQTVTQRVNNPKWDLKPGDIEYTDYTKTIPGHYESDSKVITIPCYIPLHKSIIGTFTICLAKVSEISSNRVKKLSSQKEFKKKFDLRVWKKKWVVRIENGDSSVVNVIAGQIGSFTDTRDGKTYRTVKIGNQLWMAENLNVGMIINGSQDQTNNKIIEKYCYNDHMNNCNTYGGLYTWYELMQYLPLDSVGICPKGWHIPSDEEWTTLTTNLCGECVAALNMKEPGTVHWTSPNKVATNNSKFSALPGGHYTYGVFNGIGNEGKWWSCTIKDLAWGDYRMSRSLYFWDEVANRTYSHTSEGLSVRCVNDQ